MRLKWFLLSLLALLVLLIAIDLALLSLMQEEATMDIILSI